MKIALLQMDVLLGDKEKNRAKGERMIAEAMREHPDTIMLPELWNTGFFPKDIKGFADEEGKAAQELLCYLAAKYRVNIIGGSVATLESGLVYNTSYVANRDGRIISTYKKNHLFSPAAEEQFFAAGIKAETFFLDGIKAAVVICYDIRFCELIRLLALEGISILFVVAAWPEVRLEHWRVLLRARAMENQMFVAGVNGVGQAGKVKFGGSSLLVDPWGEVVAMAGDVESIAFGTVDMDILADIRRKMAIFNDRRTDLYTLAFS